MKKLLIIFFLLNYILLIYSTENRPGWASGFFNNEEYNKFISIIRKYFNDINVNIKIDDEYVVVTQKSSYFSDKKFKIKELAKKCSKIEQSRWNKYIYAHFNKIKSDVEENMKFKETISDFEKASKILGIRIRAKSYYYSANNKNFVFMENLKDTISVLVYDEADSLKDVMLDDIEKWNKSKKELFDIAVKNVEKKYKPVPVEIKISSNIKCLVIDDIGLFNTTYVLMIDKYKKWQGKYGTITAVPNQQALLIYPVNDKNVFEFIDTMVPVIDGMYKEGPGSISPYLYWYYNNQYIKILFDIENNQYSIKIPGKLKEVVK